MEKIKILHVTQSAIGGTLEYLKLLFTFLDKNKYDIELVCPSYGPMEEEIKSMGIKVHTIEMCREISPIKDFNSYKELKKYIGVSKPDIIHLHSSKAGVLGRLADLKYQIPVVYNAHGWAFTMAVNSRKKNFYASVEKFCAKFTDKIINISKSQQELALYYKIAPKENMILIENGIDINKYKTKYSKEQITESLGIKKDSFIIGMVGRLTEAKSPATFIEIAERISQNIDNAYFILVGDGELRGEIENLIFKKGLSNKVSITGWTNEVAKYVSIFDIGLLTSKWEGFGLVLAEYMASGKPVVASDIGGISDVIRDGYNGLLVPYNDIDHFVESIYRIKDNKALRNSLIRNGYKTVNNKYDISRVVKEHDKLYGNLLKENCRRGAGNEHYFFNTRIAIPSKFRRQNLYVGKVKTIKKEWQ